MTKREIRKEAYTRIFKEGETHTNTFISLRAKSNMEGGTLAEIISGIPSKEKYENTRPIWTAYLVVLGIIILLRLLYIYIVVQQLGPNTSPAIIVPMVALSLFVLAYGIYGALKGMRHTLYMVAAFLIFGVFRGLRYSNFQINWDSYLVFGLIAALIVLTILLWTKWKTPYTKQVQLIETDAGSKKKLHYQFEDSLNSNSDILDDQI